MIKFISLSRTYFHGSKSVGVITVIGIMIEQGSPLLATDSGMCGMFGFCTVVYHGGESRDILHIYSDRAGKHIRHYFIKAE